MSVYLASQLRVRADLQDDGQAHVSLEILVSSESKADVLGPGILRPQGYANPTLPSQHLQADARGYTCFPDTKTWVGL